MIKYDSLYILLVVEFFHSIQCISVPLEKKTQKYPTDDKKIQTEHLLNLTVVNKTVQQEDRKTKEDANFFPVNNKDTSTAENYYDKQTVSKYLLQANQLRIDNVDVQNETLVLETGKRDTSTSKKNRGTQKYSLDLKKKYIPREIKKINNELQEVSLEEIELPYYTKPMMDLVVTEKQARDLRQTLLSNLLHKNEEVQKQQITTLQEDQVQQLNDDKKHLLKDNDDKEHQIKRLEVEKKKLVKVILDSINNIVKSTSNITEKKDLKELKTIIKILGDVESSKENAKANVLTTAKPPAGLLSKIKAARKTAEGSQPLNIFSPEDINGFGEGMQQDNHLARAYIEYTTRNIDKENERKEKQREKVKYNLDAWLKNRELLDPSTPDGSTKRKLIEKCESWGWTKDKLRNIFVRPCCKFCCRKSYLGCK